MNISQWDLPIWGFVLTWAVVFVAIITTLLRNDDTKRPGGDH